MTGCSIITWGRKTVDRQGPGRGQRRHCDQTLHRMDDNDDDNDNDDNDVGSLSSLPRPGGRSGAGTRRSWRRVGIESLRRRTPENSWKSPGTPGSRRSGPPPPP